MATENTPMLDIEIEGFLHRYQPSYCSNPTYLFYTFESASADCIVIQPHTIAASIPNKDYIPERVAALRAAQSKIYVEAQEAAAEIEEHLQKLLCLEAPQVIEPKSNEDIPF